MENRVHNSWSCKFSNKNTSLEGKVMTKSELIETIAARQSQLSSKDVELAVKTILEHMSQAQS